MAVTENTRDWIHCRDTVYGKLDVFTPAWEHTLPPATLHTVYAVYTWFHGISRIPVHVPDPQAAIANWAFWQAETEGMFSQQASHPATRILQNHIPTIGWDRMDFAPLLVGLREHITGNLSAESTDFSTAVAHNEQVLYRLLVRTLCPEHFDKLADFADQWAQAMARYTALRDAGLQARSGHGQFPLGIGTAPGDKQYTGPIPPQSPEEQAHWQRRFAEWTEHTRLAFQTGLAVLGNDKRLHRAMLPLCIIGRVAWEEMRLLHQEKYPVWDKRVLPTPVLKSWWLCQMYYGIQWLGRNPAAYFHTLP